LAKEFYSMKLDLLTNAAVVDDAIRFVEQKKGGLSKTMPDSISIVRGKDLSLNNNTKENEENINGSYGMPVDNHNANNDMKTKNTTF
jgi:hypothetical protein